VKRYTFRQTFTYWGDVDADSEEDARAMWDEELEMGASPHYWESTAAKLDGPPRDIDGDDDDDA
jgi:hypothetical protein